MRFMISERFRKCEHEKRAHMYKQGENERRSNKQYALQGILLVAFKWRFCLLSYSFTLRYAIGLYITLCVYAFFWARWILSDHLAAQGGWFNLRSAGASWLVNPWRASSNRDMKGQVGTQMMWQPTRTSVSHHKHSPSTHVYTHKQTQSFLCTCRQPNRQKAWNINDQYHTLNTHKQ